MRFVVCGRILLNSHLLVSPLFDLSNHSSCTIPKKLDVDNESPKKLEQAVEMMGEQYKLFFLMNELQVLQVQFNLTLLGHHQQIGMRD